MTTFGMTLSHSMCYASVLCQAPHLGTASRRHERTGRPPPAQARPQGPVEAQAVIKYGVPRL